MRRYESSLQLIRGIQQELPELKKELQPRSVEAHTFRKLHVL